MDAVQARGQRLIDAFVRSAALRATAGFCRGLESLDLPRMVPQARDPPQPVRSRDLAALERALGIERIEATWGRLRLLHAVGDQDPTTLRFLRAVVHLHIPAAESRCRFITTAGLWELGFEPWLRLPEAEQDADRARLDTDREGTEFLDKLRALGLPELLALPAQRRRELLEYWAANCGRSPPGHEHGKTS